MISDEQMEELRKLKELLDANILSQEEFESKKALILGEEDKEAPKAPVVKDNANAPSNKDVVSQSEQSVSKKGEEQDVLNKDEVNTTSEQKEDSVATSEHTTIEMPNYQANETPATPLPKKMSKKTIIIAVVAAVVVLALLMAVLGGSGNSDSGDGETVTNSSEYSTEEEPEEEEAEPVLESINAEYSGETEKGVVLDEDNTGITVTGTYDDGTTETIYGWTVEEAKTLKAGKTAKVTINYEGQSCELEVTCTSISKDEFKKSCKTVSYNDLARNPDKYNGKNIKIYGQIIQVLEGSDNSVNFRVGTKDSGYGNWYDDVFLVDYTYEDGESKYLEEDKVTMWGTYGGTYTYESTGGADITVPLLYAKYITIE